MGHPRFTEDFKIDAIKQISEREVWMLMRRELVGVERIRKTAGFLADLFRSNRVRLLGNAPDQALTETPEVAPCS